ncbi:MAG: dipeptide/oligopeptide/nickel ABC transporter permease/ATP-binding protein [Pseudomonadota bacterium]|nr:dipeptide/oligopeptide/nickel ABC transporter permease/ATP-binding protein [Pseudomonadota bacterium]
MNVLFSKIIKNKLALLGGIILFILLLLIITTPFLNLSDPNAINTSDRFSLPFTSNYLLGADHLGRDILSRVMWGTRLSLAVGFSAALIAAILGSFIGIIAGYFGGFFDNILMRSVDVLMAFPYVLLALAIVAVMGPGLFNSLIAVAIVNIPFFARNVRGISLAYAKSDFMIAAKISGRSTFSCIIFELLPNLIPTIIVAFSTTIGWMILETAGLSFLGLGSQPPQADLGSMLGEGRASLIVHSHNSLIPGLMILFIVMGFNLFGDGIRDALDPKLSQGKLGRSKALTDLKKNFVFSERCSKSFLEVNDLTTKFIRNNYEIEAIKKVNLSLQKGECLAIVGESGSGKSVTALSITRLVASPPGIITEGFINYKGTDLLNINLQTMQDIRGKKISYIFQDPQSTLHPLQKVGSQISEIVINHKIINKVKLNKEVLELLRNVKIKDPERVVNLYPHQLSGGMRQRIGIAMAIANKPDIIIADEPTTALDVTVQAKILSIINDLKKEFNLSIIFISHDLNVVSKISDNIAVMFNGEIVEFGKTKKILNNPNNQYTKKLIKSSLKLSLVKKKYNA